VGRICLHGKKEPKGSPLVIITQRPLRLIIRVSAYGQRRTDADLQIAQIGHPLCLRLIHSKSKVYRLVTLAKWVLEDECMDAD
jgi:hypothetical protein